MIIRSKSLRQWVRANFDKEQLEDIMTHGCVSGFPGVTYYKDTGKLYDHFSDEIWQMVYDGSQDAGMSELEYIASFNGSNVGSHAQFANLLVWFAVEEIARELTEDTDDEGDYASAFVPPMY